MNVRAGMCLISRQDRMITNLRDPEVATLDTGHLPMLGRPEALAQVLDKAAAS